MSRRYSGLVGNYDPTATAKCGLTLRGIGLNPPVADKPTEFFCLMCATDAIDGKCLCCPDCMMHPCEPDLHTL